MAANLRFLAIPLILSFLFLLPEISLAENGGSCSIEVPCAEQTPTISAPGSNVSLTDNGYCVYFFYGNGCPHCARVEPYIEELSKKYPNFAFMSFEIYGNQTSRELFNNFNDRYGIKSENRGIPTVFISDRALIGEDAIKKSLEPSIQYFGKNQPVCPLEYNVSKSGTHGISPIDKLELTLPVVIAAAVVDSINPCAFAVMAFLLSYIGSLGSRKKVLQIGLVYSGVVFITYLLSGLGLFTFIQAAKLTLYVYALAAIIAIIAGLINIKDFFWFGKGFSLKIPESKKGRIKKYVKEATIPAAIMLGIFVSMVELPCTGEVYLTILALLSSQMTLWQGLPYLILYNFIFVLPLLIITFLFYKESSAEKVDKFRLKYRRWMKLGIGLVLLALGGFMVYEMI
jgi:cytochrome c biogenesis protein CcdA/thiol-disulfide isomerase/thioredoxin